MHQSTDPIRINFDNQIELIGYQLSTLAPSAGEPVDLTLFWRRLRSIQQDYTVFVHILNPATQAIYAASDKQPVAGNAQRLVGTSNKSSLTDTNCSC